MTLSSASVPPIADVRSSLHREQPHAAVTPSYAPGQSAPGVVFEPSAAPPSEPPTYSVGQPGHADGSMRFPEVPPAVAAILTRAQQHASAVYAMTGDLPISLAAAPPPPPND